MTTTTKLSLITLLAAATATAGSAAADPDGFRRGGNGGNGRWTQIGEVGTHSHDAEDYVPVNSKVRFERIALTSEGRPVRLDGVDIQFVDGRKYRINVRETLQPGQRMTLDVPSYSPIKMLVLDYGNRGRTFRDREDSKVRIVGQVSSYRDNDRRSDRIDRRGRGDRRIQQQPQQPQQPVDGRFQWRGGVYIRLGT